MNENKNLETCAADYLYDCRENFSIVALTGISGSGCSSVARMMADSSFYTNVEYDVRKPSDVSFDKPDICLNTLLYDKGKQEFSHNALKQLIFKREYTICHNFLKVHYKPYITIKYNKVLWLLLLRFFVCKHGEDEVFAKDGETLKRRVKERVKVMYHPSYAKAEDDDNDEQYIASYGRKYANSEDMLDGFPEEKWKLLYEQIVALRSNDNDRDSVEKEKWYNIFFGENSVLDEFYKFFNDKYSKLDYYCYSFFYHRLGFGLRAKKNQIIDFNQDFDSLLNANENLFCVVKEINWLIKCLRNHDKINVTKEKEKLGVERPFSVRVCIDSLRNSLEVAFLRERYSAFYLIAINDDKRPERLKHKIKARVFGDVKMTEENSQYLRDMQNKAESLCLNEVGSSQYEHGQFAGANVEQCIMDAEIHFVQAPKDTKTKPADFFSVGEQWLKFASLIFHPGLITPSSEERCMEVAYNAKFNSGCLSRQVGAVITNRNHSIRTIGWNDVPYGQIPCSLREIPDLIDTTQESVNNQGYRSCMYSLFELSEDAYPKYKKRYKAKSFVEGMRLDFEATIEQRKKTLNGLPYPYCFKDCHNAMMDDKNQVFTKSLHAEENAMMQMVKYGGERLIDGIIYVTASPCELCSKKLYQLGVRKIVYIDPYPGIAREHILSAGFRRPALQLYKGAYGASYNKLYKPIMAYKDELKIRLKKFDPKKEK